MTARVSHFMNVSEFSMLPLGPDHFFLSDEKKTGVRPMNEQLSTWNEGNLTRKRKRNQ